MKKFHAAELSGDAEQHHVHRLQHYEFNDDRHAVRYYYNHNTGSQHTKHHYAPIHDDHRKETPITRQELLNRMANAHQEL